MDDIIFATATWARTQKESEVILSSLRSLSKFKKRIVVGDKSTSDFPLAKKLSEIPGISIVSGETLDDQRREVYLEAAKIGKNIFWLESDKKFFIENELEKILTRDIPEEHIVIPFPDKHSFNAYPPFQKEIENCLNKIVGLYIHGDRHLTYGPMMFPSRLVEYIGMSKKELGWGMNVFLAVIGSAQGMQLDYVEVVVPHDVDIQDGESLRRFRLEQVIDYARSIQEASYLIEKK